MIKKFLAIVWILCCTISNVNAATLNVVQNLSFGTLVPVSSSGSMTISTAGSISSSNGVTVAPSGTSYYQGKVRFTPTLLDVFTIRATNSTVVLTNTTSGGGTVTINNFTVNPSTLNITVLSTVDINVGGQMTFSSSSKSGTYTGNVRIEVSGLLAGTIGVSLPITLTLWNSLQMSETVQMSFGALEVTSGSSVVRLSAQTGQRSVVSGSGNVSLSANPASAAGTFQINGQPGVTVSVSLPSSITLTGSSGGTMSVNNVTGYPSSTQLSLNTTGQASLNVGGDLNIGTSQASGTYSGTYAVTINY